MAAIIFVGEVAGRWAVGEAEAASSAAVSGAALFFMVRFYSRMRGRVGGRCRG
jgi:hypothetical protein